MESQSSLWSQGASRELPLQNFNPARIQPNRTNPGPEPVEGPNVNPAFA